MTATGGQMKYSWRNIDVFQPTTKANIARSVLNKCRTILPPGEYSSCEDKIVDIHMYYTVNMAVLNYFGTQIPEIEKIDRQIKIESADLHGKDLMWSEDYFTVIDVLLSENPVILTVKYLQVESYEDEEILTEYTFVNPIWFKDVVDCIVNDEKVHLTIDDLALSNTKKWKRVYTTNQWLAVVLIAILLVF